VQVELPAARGNGVTERENLGMNELKNVRSFEQSQLKPPHLGLRMGGDSQAQSEHESGSESQRISDLDLHPRGV